MAEFKEFWHLYLVGVMFALAEKYWPVLVYGKYFFLAVSGSAIFVWWVVPTFLPESSLGRWVQQRDHWGEGQMAAGLSFIALVACGTGYGLFRLAWWVCSFLIGQFA